MSFFGGGPGLALHALARIPLVKQITKSLLGRRKKERKKERGEKEKEEKRKREERSGAQKD